MKLYKLDIGYEPNGCKVDAPIEATPAEIMAAHPRCETCKYCWKDPDYRDEYECKYYNSIGVDRKVYPEKDYCNDWEAR